MRSTCPTHHIHLDLMTPTVLASIQAMKLLIIKLSRITFIPVASLEHIFIRLNSKYKKLSHYCTADHGLHF